MKCYDCGVDLTEHDFCTNCGADVAQYKRIIRTSNYYYNDGLEKARVRDLSGAIVSLKECLKLNKLNIEARNLLGLVYFEMGETVAALSEWIISKNYQQEKNVADTYIGAVQDSPSQLESLNQAIRKYNQALTYCRNGSQDLGIIQLKKVLSTNPRFLKAHQLLALLYIHNEEWEKAKRELNKCSRIDISNTRTLRYMKEVTAALKLDEELKGSRRSSKSNEILTYQSGNETIIQPLNVREPKKNYFGIIYMFVGLAIGLAVALTLILPARVQSAKSQLNEELRSVGEQLDKKNADMDAQLQQIKNLTEEKEKLDAQLEAFAGTDGTLQAVEDLLTAAYVYLDVPDDIAAVTNALEEINIEAVESENTSDAYKNLYQKIMEQAGPRISRSLFSSGNKAYKAGEYDAAVVDFEKAFNYDETNVDALFNLGNAYKKKGDSRNAVTVYNQVIEKFPNTERARRAREYLKELES